MGARGNDQDLRWELAGRLIAQGSIHDDAVAAAFRTVPRHRFVPGVPLEVAYADDVVLMKRNEAGVAISTVSQPTVVAIMLEQAGLRPGHRVLEIGSGGYNAALIAELVGPGGAVTTIDIDPDVVGRARNRLDDAGYGRVRVERADGEYGHPAGAPYDRIIVTVTAWDIPPAWWEQLRPGGRIVVPIRMRGQTRSIVFESVDGRLISRSSTLCGFVCMQGAGANLERLLPIDDGLVAVTADADQHFDSGPTDETLRGPSRVLWTGVLVGAEEPLADLALWIASTVPGYCVLSAERVAVEAGLVDPAPRFGAAAAIQDDSIGYVTARLVPDFPREATLELGARGHGPSAPALTELLANQIQSWNTHHRPTPTLEASPTITTTALTGTPASPTSTTTPPNSTTPPTSSTSTTTPPTGTTTPPTSTVAQPTGTTTSPTGFTIHRHHTTFTIHWSHP